ncbi:hypothetical protein [uncultured Thiodictyon sp.]|nr:hypothetical protein [uncultured Thiodictyon sp.]
MQFGCERIRGTPITSITTTTTTTTTTRHSLTDLSYLLVNRS